MKKLGLVIIVLAIIALGIAHNEYEIKNCMADGYSENFCRYAGE